MKKYPDWICAACGIKYGKRDCGIATWHSGKCDVCGEDAIVTEPRDFGHLKDGWNELNKKANITKRKAKEGKAIDACR